MNFATPRWLELGRKAQNCKCMKDTVYIDMKVFESALKKAGIDPKKVFDRKSKSPSTSLSKFEVQIEDSSMESEEFQWRKCRKCSKKRKISTDFKMVSGKEFFCKMLGNIDCRTKEDSKYSKLRRVTEKVGARGPQKRKYTKKGKSIDKAISRVSRRGERRANRRSIVKNQAKKARR